MDINNLLQRLSYGPLSGLSLANDGNGTIKAEKIPAIVGMANEALLRLYSRFILSEQEVVLEQQEGQTRYLIDSKHAVSNLDVDPETVTYIKDSEAKPFTDDLIKILSVYDGDGCELPLNDQNHNSSVFTPQFNVLQVPVPVQGRPLYIMYQAKHAKLLPAQLSDPIILPEVLEEALLSYVAHLVFSPMNGQEHLVKSQEHLSKYDVICQEAVDRDLVNSSIATTLPKFNARGFV